MPRCPKCGSAFDERMVECLDCKLREAGTSMAVEKGPENAPSGSYLKGKDADEKGPDICPNCGLRLDPSLPRCIYCDEKRPGSQWRKRHKRAWGAIIATTIVVLLIASFIPVMYIGSVLFAGNIEMTIWSAYEYAGEEPVEGSRLIRLDVYLYNGNADPDEYGDGYMSLDQTHLHLITESGKSFNTQFYPFPGFPSEVAYGGSVVFSAVFQTPIGDDPDLLVYDYADFGVRVKAACPPVSTG